ncbi:MAG: hypothetical protein WBI14_07625 [Anaerolineaceae bacterium]
MDRPLKLTMAVPISTRSADRPTRRVRLSIRMRHRRERLVLLALLLVILTSAIVVTTGRSPKAAMVPPLDLPAVQPNMVQIVQPTATPEPSPSPTATTIPTAMQEVEPIESAPVILPTQAQPVTLAKDIPIPYYAQSGDSIGVLAVRFGVDISEITSAQPLPEEGFIPEGQLLLIPNKLEKVSSSLRIFPDSEVVNSPSAIGFDVDKYVEEAGGYLSTYSQLVFGVGTISGAEIVKRVALEYSIHPRLLLALLEYESGWVFGQPETLRERNYPLGFVLEGRLGLHKQLVYGAGWIATGYYGWREGTVVAVQFQNFTQLRMSANLNCGTAGLMYYFGQKYLFDDWAEAIYSDQGFIATYESMFGNPWLTAQAYEPLFTPDVRQPELILPFESGVTWSYTGGPHAAWGAAEVRAAIDFAPPSSEVGCTPNQAWVVASAPGLVVRSENGVVVLDLDGDGNEQTGWNLVYLHIATNGRIRLGSWLNAGDRVGHPSCEGGISSGTHLHFARKYNGEWVPAEGPLSFVLNGWKAKAGSNVYQGWLIRGDQIVRANLYGTTSSHVSRVD